MASTILKANFVSHHASVSQNSGLVNDFIQQLHAPGTIVLDGIVREFVESSGVNVGIYLGVPLFIEIALQPVAAGRARHSVRADTPRGITARTE